MWFGTTPDSDIDRGREAVRVFHNTSLIRYPNQYKISEEELLAALGKKEPDIFLDSLGLAIRSNNMTGGQVEDAMEELANRAAGRIPTSQFPFFQALTDRMQDISFGDFVMATPEIAAGMAGDAIKGAAAVGDAVLDTAKSLLQFGPLFAVVAIGFILYARTRQAAGR